jgi:hypothetical protein
LSQLGQLIYGDCFYFLLYNILSDVILFRIRQEVKGDTPAADELAYLSSIEREGDPKIFSVAPCDDAGVWGSPSSSLEANRH